MQQLRYLFIRFAFRTLGVLSSRARRLTSSYNPKSFAYLLCTVFLASCSWAPHYQRPDAPIPHQWTAASASEAPKNQMGWRDFFKDLQLQKLIEIALQNNRDLQTAVLNVEKVRAQYQIQRADLLPTINGNAAATRARTPSNVLLDGESTFGSIPAAIDNSYSVGVGVTAFELDLFGRVRSLKDTALFQYLASEYAQKSAYLSLVAQVAQAYFSVQADEDLLNVARATLKTREQSYQLMRRQLKLGAISQIDFVNAQTLLQSAQLEVSKTERQKADDLSALMLLLGQSLPEDLDFITHALNTDELAQIPAGLSSEVLVQRPDIIAAEQQLKAANANIGAARAAFFPKISLTGSWGLASTALNNLFEQSAYAWSFGSQLTVPIFDWGRNSAQLDLAQVQKKIEIVNYEKAIQTAFREVNDALNGTAYLDTQVSWQAELVNLEKKRAQLTDLRYRDGLDSALDFLDAQRSLFSAQKALVQLKLQQLLQKIALYKALGGGVRE